MREQMLADNTILRQAMVILAKDFGTCLQLLRQRSHVFQCDVAATLAIFSAQVDYKGYLLIEQGRCAPRFRDLAAIYKALVRSGVKIHAEERVTYLLLARQRIASKRTRNAPIEAEHWYALAAELAVFDTSD